MMNGRHLPAGQGVHHETRRRQQYNNQPLYQQQPQQAMYNPGYYGQSYYPQAPPPPQHYYNTGMPPQQYNPYMYGRSPSLPYQQYPMVSPVLASPSYGQPGYSPAIVSSPYQPPPVPTPSSTQSAYIAPVPMPFAPALQSPPPPIAQAPPPPTFTVGAPEFIPAPQPTRTPEPISHFTSPHMAQSTQFFEGVSADQDVAPQQSMPPTKKIPWFSRPDLPWPQNSRPRKRKLVSQRPKTTDQVEDKHNESETAETVTSVADTDATFTPRPETPSTTQPPSEHAPSEHGASEPASTTPTTPLSAQPVSADMSKTITPTSAKAAPRVIALPLIPAIPKGKAQPKTTPPVTTPKKEAAKEVKIAAPKPTAAAAAAAAPVAEKAVDIINQIAGISINAAADKAGAKEEASAEATPAEEPKPAPAPAKPSSWAALLKPVAFAAPKAAAASKSNTPAEEARNATKSNTENLADALVSFSAKKKDAKIAFLEPRGLVNTGNMCYMNSVLQVLVFCIPFYNFLEQVGKKAKHSFKSDTPLIDAMIMFMREFPILDSATSVSQLNAQLQDKKTALEKYGDAFTPDFVYDIIRQLPRFKSMERGHQQDAEEFLGFLLEGLHDECVSVMKAAEAETAAKANSTEQTNGEANGWLEVGAKQKTAVTRSSGHAIDSPMTKIFGGSLRSVLRVPGLKDSVTMEPYQPLQLDIHLPEIHNITDALKGLTRPENISGDFKSPRGSNVVATKQLSIETLPPVLILHLKRFRFDESGGTQKIWKKIGYPLELEIPKDVFAKGRQPSSIPKYRLSAVVYHHGKNASGGHYTVDVRRQDGREWIRMDDTVIRRVKAEDVAEGGSEEDATTLRAAMAQHKGDTMTSAEIFASMGEDMDADHGAQNEWKQVNGSNGAKKSAPVTNGTNSPRKKMDSRFDVHDNKVAYLLFYQRLE